MEYIEYALTRLIGRRAGSDGDVDGVYLSDDVGKFGGVGDDGDDCCCGDGEDCEDDVGGDCVHVHFPSLPTTRNGQWPSTVRKLTCALAHWITLLALVV